MGGSRAAHVDESSHRLRVQDPAEGLILPALVEDSADRCRPRSERSGDLWSKNPRMTEGVVVENMAN